MKKILFVNARRKTSGQNTPHLGFAILSAVLKNASHDVKVIDYTFMANWPPIEDIIEEYEPDVIGLSVYTPSVNEAIEMIERIEKYNLPIIVGGPHATLYTDELQSDKRIDYIFKGEAESSIVQIVENAIKEKEPVIIESELSDLKLLPTPDFTVFSGIENIKVYPIQTSRGCPHKCSFCAVKKLSSRKWRAKDPELCVDELMKAKNEFLKLEKVIIYDDDPFVRKGHIELFLNKYVESGVGLELDILNTRADRVSEDLLILLKKAGCTTIGIGFEHGHPEVFENIGKQETIEEIINAANLIKKHGLKLILSFIIGLPGDSPKKAKHSLKIAKKLKPDLVFWHLLVPYKGTQVREWYDEHGRVFGDINVSPNRDNDFMCDDPCVETDDFLLEERKKFYLRAILETADRRISIKRHNKRLLSYVIKYSLYISYLRFLWTRVQNKIRRA